VRARTVGPKGSADFSLTVHIPGGITEIRGMRTHVRRKVRNAVRRAPVTAAVIQT
jgi:hypothetical protein